MNQRMGITQIKRWLSFFLVFTVLVWPVVASGQVSLNSNNFIMDNISFSSVYTLETEAGIIPPTISSAGPLVTDLRHNQATIEWETDINSTSNIFYGPTTAYGQETGSSSFVKRHKVTVFGLKPETLYHFKAVSTDPAGGKGISADRTFTTTAEAGIKSIRISGTTYNEAIVEFETSDYSEYTVEYGKTTRYGSQITNTTTAGTTAHTVRLTNLEAGVEYHLRIKVKNEKGSEAESSDFTFTTIPLPSFTALQVVPVNANTANMVIRTNTPTTKVIYYKDITHPDSKELSIASTEFSLDLRPTIENLVGETEYSVRVVIADQGGKQNESSRQTFRTPRDGDPPKISDLQVTTTRTADEITFIATWKTNEPATSSVTVYQKGQENQEQKLPGPDELSNTHTVVGEQLKPSKLYTLIAEAKDAAGNVATQEITFRTPKASQSIFTLLAANFGNAFGWLIDLLK